jgi:hypothetical protein
MKRNSNTEGRISEHFGGLGTVTPEMVQRRAEEIALINGRSSNQVLESDFRQAKEELIGQEPVASADEGNEPLPESKRWDPIPASVGRAATRVEPDDEQAVPERLVEEGVDEAEHDIMVEATREAAKRDTID